ncbi:hypothetical protein AGABI2DRAFT_225212 [Agaricus bisporus var. bisporus H97]|uniref:hypothetical protein n=1 Tax=Agaricus bisporus var. bisporus (strain H97 / ATCC MYA-4626 / FGSC 10389) TaxID=936046 RepID=UPI00029F7E43|nr:hypothetical protein AGABI2DRAFT_225212 [Agaricus bisporus var. bisporus H97]EKV45281.1 hypothetical protein AGABI2DRAFT_225212 [Agaricus bisporus var. bisporus H97]
MATLTRPKTAPSSSNIASSVAAAVPTPFPLEELRQIQLAGSSSSHSHQLAAPGETVQNDLLQSDQAEPAQEESAGLLTDLIPSISYVQRSCIMTLNNLLSSPTHWNPIVPDRRHSMPTSPQSPTLQLPQTDSPSSALHILALNLRQQHARSDMVQVPESASDTELLHELRNRVDVLAADLPPTDAELVQTLVSLLAHLNRLSVISATPCHSAGRSLRHDVADDPEFLPLTDLFDMLKRQLSDLQLERLTSQPDLLPPGLTPVLAVESALLWTRIDEELEKIVDLCRGRADGFPDSSIDTVPPQYNESEFEDGEHPPDYEMNPWPSLDDTKTKPSQPHSRLTDEKMRMDLESVTMAIDRLYMVAPQLHNQRVELKSSKLAELERARQEGGSSTLTQSTAIHSKQRENEMRELENLLNLLGKASDRSLRDQAVIVEGGMQGRLDKARQRDIEKRNAFVEKLAQHSDSRRIHDQDATLQPRTKDPNALLTLPEFIRESVPPELIKSDPQALLSLPEFVKELPPLHLVAEDEAAPTVERSSSSSQVSKLIKNTRTRSSSAPPLSWFRPYSFKASHRPKSRGSTAFDVFYVAENYENLRHILVYFTASGATPGVDIEAEVPATSIPHEPEPGCDFLQLTSGTLSSGPLLLPGNAIPGKKEVKVQRGHFEVKIPTTAYSSSPSTPSLNTTPQAGNSTGTDESLLDASQLSASNPTTFICASCSLPLIHSSRISDYRDLPSEHWEELVEAWMCHSDQKLHEHVTKHSRRGFWPKEAQALVGGSYILFESSAINGSNLYASAELKNSQSWSVVRCLCGNVVGRCQKHEDDVDGQSMMYRMFKYAIRPVSPTTEPLKIPLTAFIVGDMLEYVSAHATYRFVIRDDEEERARILIWLFKPGMRISYSAPSNRIIPKTASIFAAKVLFKLLGPAEASTDLNDILARYPGFPQAEYLSYPMDVCQRLAITLKETNSVYPDYLRTMADLSVGWLRRV